MMNKLISITTAVILALAISACDTEQDNDVLDTIEKGTVALEDGVVKDAVKLTTKDFLGYPGKVNRRSLAWRLKNLFDSSGGISIHYPTPDVDIDGDTALVEGPFVTARAGMEIPELRDLQDDPEGWVEAAEELTQVHRAEIRLIKSKNTWLVQTIRFF